MASMTQCMFVATGAMVCVAVEAEAVINYVSVLAEQDDVRESKELRLAEPERRFLGSASFQLICAPSRVTIIARFSDGTDDSYSRSDVKPNRIFEA